MNKIEKTTITLIAIASFCIIFAVLWMNREKFTDGTMYDGNFNYVEYELKEDITLPLE